MYDHICVLHLHELTNIVRMFTNIFIPVRLEFGKQQVCSAHSGIRSHICHWATYQACSVNEKAQYFTFVTPNVNTMLAHVNSGLVAMPLKLKIQSPIVDVLIGKMFFHPDDQGGTTQKKALKLYKHVDGGIDSEIDSEIDRDYYEVVVSNREQFSLIVRHLSRGMSFHQCVDIHDDTKAVLGITFKTRKLSNSNGYHPNWKPHRHESHWVCQNRPCGQSPTYHHYSRSSKEPLLLGILAGKRWVNPLRQIVPQQPHSSARQQQTHQLSSPRDPDVREAHW
jgi:hypothetical protein